MARFELLDHVPAYTPYRTAKGAQLFRLCQSLRVGQCLQINGRSEAEMREHRRRLFGRVTAPRLVAPEGYEWRTSIRKVGERKYVLLVWLQSPKSPQSQSQNPESSESQSPESENPESLTEEG